MSSVDNRIVEMEFDNVQFQKGVTQTINSIDELKKSLRFDGIEKGFEKVEKGLKDIDPSAISKAMDRVIDKFSVLGTMADQAIRRITDQITGKLLDALKETLNLLTGIGYSMDGFKEYELKIGSIQTIAANTGALSKNLQNDAKEVIKLTEEEEKVAQDVIKGLYGVDAERRRLLEAAGYDYSRIQSRVNDIMAGVNSNIDETGKKTKTTLADIDAALDDLNIYADKTIYSFSQMTNAVGRFTTAGIDLETSTESVKAISNLAALSGATNANLQSAMYNFSQAMQKGSMQLLDWRSIENANMASATFKEAIMETARVHGIAIDQMIAENGSFNETLSKGWLTNDIMIESLSKLTAFTEDMSEAEREAERARWKEIGYTEQQIDEIEDLSRVAYEAATKVRTFSQLVGTLKEEVGSSYSMMWQNIVGNFDEATELWTDLHDAIQNNFITPMSKARDEKWKFFHDNGGREAAIEGFTNTGKGLLAVIHAISDAWHEVFPRDDGRRITALAKGFAEFSKKLVVSEETAKKIKLTFQGLFSILHIGVTIIKMAVKIVGLFIKALGKLSGTEHPILSLTARLGELLIALDKFISSSETTETVVGAVVWIFIKLAEVIGFAAEKVRYFVEEIAAPKLLATFDKLKGGIHDFVTSSKKDVDELDGSEAEKSAKKTEKVWTKIADALDRAFNRIKSVFTTVWEWIKKTYNVLKGLISEGADRVTVSAVIEAIIGFEAFTTLRAIKKFLDGSGEALGNITDILDGVKSVLKSYALEIKTKALMTIAKATLMLVAAIIAMSFIDSNRLWNAVGAMTALMTAMTIMTIVISKVSDTLSVVTTTVGEKVGLSTDIGKVLFHISEALLLMVAAVAVLSFLDPKKMANGMAALTVLMGLMAGFVFVISKVTKMTTGANLAASAALIVATTMALNAMLIPLVVLSFLPTERVSMASSSLVKILVVLTAAIAAIAFFTRTANPSSLVAASVLIYLMADAMNALMIPVVVLALVPQDRVAQATLVMVGLLATFSLFVGAMVLLCSQTSAPRILSIAVVLLALAVAINALIIPAIAFALIPENAFQKVAIILAVLMVAIVEAIRLIPEKSGGRAKALTGLALAVMSIATALILLMPFDWSKLLLAAISLGVVIAAFALLVKTLGKRNPEKVAKSMASICAAIIVMTGALLALSSLNADDLMSAITAFAIFMGIMIASAGIIGMFPSFVLGINALGSAMLNLGAGVALLGAGILFITKALDILEGIDTIVIGYKIVALFAGISAAIAGSLPILATAVFTVFTEIIVQIGENASRILGAVVKVISAICDAIIELVPKIGKTLLKVLLGIIGVLTDNMDEIVASIFGLVIALFNALGDWLNDIENTEKLVDSIMNFLTGVVTLILSTIVVIFRDYIWDQCIKPICEHCGGLFTKAFDIIKDGLSSAWHVIADWFMSKVNWVNDKLNTILNCLTKARNAIKGEALKDRASFAAAYSLAGIFGLSDEAVLKELEDKDNQSWGAYIKNIEQNGTDAQKARLEAYQKIGKVLNNLKNESGIIYDVEGNAFDANKIFGDTTPIKFDFDENKNLIASYYDSLGNLFEYNLGQNIVTDKIIADYEGKNYEIARKAGQTLGTATAQGVSDGYRAAMDINSPASDKDWLDAGKYTTEGLYNGMTSALPESSTDFAKSFTSIMTDALSGVDMSSMVDTSSMTDITTYKVGADVTPVMNMDQFNSQLNTDTTIPVSDATIYTAENIKGNVDLKSDDFTKNLADDVSSSMSQYQQDMLDTTNAIYEEVASLRSYISELEIRLDTSALVGSLVGPMDTALGQRANAKSRGV